MAHLRYPWTWATDSLAGFFTLRLPWLDQLESKLGTDKPLCILIPRAAGPISQWTRWLDDWLWERGVDHATATSSDLKTELLNLLGADIPDDLVIDAAPLFQFALQQYRAAVGQVTPRRWLASFHADTSWSVLDLWLETQRRLGAPALNPVVVATEVPLHSDWEVVRFSSPEIVGNLHRAEVYPDGDPHRWAALYMTLTVLWECGSMPLVADQLWAELEAELPAVTHDQFDELLRRKVTRLSIDRSSAILPLIANNQQSRSAWIRAAKQRSLVSDCESHVLWNAGVLIWNGSAFELSPMIARGLLPSLSSDDCEILKRRRLTNVPLARWLAGWATTVESGLRLAALNLGTRQVELYLKNSRPVDSRFENRFEELTNGGRPNHLIELANWIDLERFLMAQPSVRATSVDLARTRTARNEIIHEHETSARAVIALFRTVDWLEQVGAL